MGKGDTRGRAKVAAKAPPPGCDLEAPKKPAHPRDRRNARRPKEPAKMRESHGGRNLQFRHVRWQRVIQ